MPLCLAVLLLTAVAAPLATLFLPITAMSNAMQVSKLVGQEGLQLFKTSASLPRLFGRNQHAEIWDAAVCRDSRCQSLNMDLPSACRWQHVRGSLLPDFDRAIVRRRHERRASRMQGQRAHGARVRRKLLHHLGIHQLPVAHPPCALSSCAAATVSSSQVKCTYCQG